MTEILCTQQVDNDAITPDVQGEQPKYFMTLEHNGRTERLMLAETKVIGRDPECSVFVDDNSLSRMHASIEVDENGLCMLTDLGSLNGSKRNGLNLKPRVRYELRPGDRIQLGNLTGCIHLSSTDDSLEATQLSNGEHYRTPLEDLNNTPFGKPPISTVVASEKLTIRSGSPANESDAESDVSSNMLARIVIDPEQITDDLLPNPSQYVSRSPSPILGDQKQPVSTHNTLLSELLVCETQLEPDFQKSLVYGHTESNAQLGLEVGETEPFDGKEAVLTGSPILPITRTSEPTGHEAKCTATPLSSCRAARVDIAQITPLDEKKKAIASTPCVTFSSTGPLACDSEPGLYSSHHVSSEVQSRCWELPETQPEVPTESALFVEESELLWAPVSESRSHDLPNGNLSPPLPKPASGYPQKDDQSATVHAAPRRSHSSLDSEPVDLALQDSQLHSESELADMTQPMLSGTRLMTKERSPTPAKDNISGVEREKNGFSLPPSNVVTNLLEDIGELTQPMLHLSTAKKRISVRMSSVVDLDISDLEKAQTSDSGSPVNRATTADSSPHEAKLVDTFQLENEPDEKVDSSSTRLDPTVEKGDDGMDELTQPMVQLKPLLPSALSRASLPGGWLSSEPRLQERTVDNFSVPKPPSHSTPPNAPQLLEAHKRLAKTTVKRHQIRTSRNSVAGRVSSLFLTKSIGVVQFRSRRGDECSMEKDSDDSVLEGKDIFELPGPSFGLVRRASQVFSVTPAVAETRKLTHLLSGRKPADKKSSKRTKSKKANVLEIPSPVRLPDSLLSEDTSQLELSAEAAPEINQNASNSPEAGHTATKGTTKVVPSTPVSATEKINERLATPLPLAVASAGFDYSPQDTEGNMSPVVLPLADVTNHSFQLNSTPLPVVDLSSFTDVDIDPHLIRQNGRSSATMRSSISASPSPAYIPRGTRSRKRAGSSPTNASMPEQPEESHKQAKRSKRSPPAPTRRSRRNTMDTKPRNNKDDSPSKALSTRPRRKTRLTAITEHVQPVKNIRTRRLTSLEHKTLDLTNLSDDSFVVLERCSPKAKLQLLFSGVESSRFNRILPAIEACETEDVMLATHLITDRWKRTIKMLFARARGLPIISHDWLTACLRTRKKPYPDPLQFRLNAPTPPSSPGSRKRRLSRSLNAPQNQEQVKFLHGWSIGSTPGVSPAPDDLARLTELAGGTWMPYSELCNISASKKPSKTVLVTTEHDWSEIRSGKKKRKSKTLPSADVPSVSVEWFLQTIMQRIPPRWPVDESLLIS